MQVINQNNLACPKHTKLGAPPLTSGNHKQDFETVFTEKQPEMIRLAYLLLHSQQLAEEAVQDAFIQLFQRFSSIQNPGGFLRIATINGCRDLQRRQGTERRYLHRFRHPIHSTDNANPLHDVLAGLNHRKREVIVLKFFLGYRATEIAKLFKNT